MPEQPSAWLVSVLGSIAGAVDAVGYKVLGHVYISNMTGNTEGISMALTGGDMTRALERAIALVAFVGGAFAGTLIAGQRPTARRRVLVLELILVAGTAAAIFGLAPHGGPLDAKDPRFYVVALLAAGSMGVQNVSLVAGDQDGSFTTHVTGALTSLAKGAAERLTGRHRHLAGHGALFLAFAIGGILTLLVFARSPLLAALLPVPVLAILVVGHALD